DQRQGEVRVPSARPASPVGAAGAAAATHGPAAPARAGPEDVRPHGSLPPYPVVPLPVPAFPETPPMAAARQPYRRFRPAVLRLEDRVVPTTFSFLEATGANAAAIQSTVDSFRTSLGTLNANTAGSVGSGRREINWDGVPDNKAAPNALPADFFNTTSPRGAVFATAGSGFEVSGNSGVA